MHTQLRHAVGCAALVWIAAASVAQQATAGPGLSESAVLPPTPAAVFAGRRARLAARLDVPGAVVFVESGARPRGEHDTDFRVHSDFAYLTGLRAPDATLLVWRDDRGAARSALLVPARDEQRERWEGPSLHAGSPHLRRARLDRVLTADTADAEGLLASLGEPAGRPARRLIAGMRLRKDVHEIARIEQACAITSRALAEAIRSMEAGMREREVDALIRYVFRRLGAQRAAFPGIVGSGPNSCVLHHRPTERRLGEGELVVMDVGAELDRYAADITRTVPVSGRFSPRQRELYMAVLKAQQAAIAAVRPGLTLRDVDRAARASLREDGLAKHFHHGTSHWVGLDVHDVGRYDTTLEPGMVLTVEPGVYLEEEAHGIRIEDVVVVTGDGGRVISGGIPRHPDAIEALMRERGLGNAPVAPAPGGRTRAGSF
jgi:Xaa-Pro aminopeptidase